MLLLQTKLYTPSLPPALVSRPHLLDRLTRGLHGKLTLVCAPAGSGKTTLLRNWLADIQQQEQRVSAWLTLDILDNNLTCFFSYLIAAIQTIVPEIGQTALAGLETQQAPNVLLFLTHLINEIAALDTPFVLVLDDFHMITDPTLHEAVAFLVDYLPSQMHLVLSSRTIPPIALARLRAQGQVTQLRAADLCFTLTEATTFFNTVMGLDLITADIEVLEQHTEGWIAGLHLAAQALQGLDTLQASDFLASFAGDHHDIATVSRLFTQSIALCRTVGNSYFAALFTANLIEVLLVQGQLHRAERAFGRLLQFPEKHDGPEIGMMCVSIAMVYLERNDLQMAEAYLKEGIERCRPFDAWAGVVFVGLLRLARIRSLQRDIDGAYALLKEAEQFEERGRASQIPFPIPRLETAQVQLWLIQGNLAAALSWATDWRTLASHEGLRCSDEVEYLTLIRILIAQARKQGNGEWAEEAKQLVSSLLQFAQNTGRTSHIIEMYLLQALVDQMQENMALAFISLQKALSLAEPEGYVCLFSREGEPMARLLREAAIKGIASDYCTLLLAAFSQEELSDKSNEHPSSFSAPSYSLTDSLTKQEWKTLQLLATPLAVPQIAAELIVEVSTIRTHIKRIYSKLDAHTRIEAVQRAKELGILEIK